MHYSFNDMKKLINYNGHYKGNLLKVLEYLDPNGSSSFNNWVDTGRVISTNRQCVCKMDIEHVHSVKHKVTGDTLDIGSSCIGKFSPQMKKEVSY